MPRARCSSIDQLFTGRPETDRKLKLTADNAFLYMGFNPPKSGPFLHPSDPRYKDPGEQYQLSAWNLNATASLPPPPARAVPKAHGQRAMCRLQ